MIEENSVMGNSPCAAPCWSVAGAHHMDVAVYVPVRASGRGLPPLYGMHAACRAADSLMWSTQEAAMRLLEPALHRAAATSGQDPAGVLGCLGAAFEAALGQTWTVGRGAAVEVPLRLGLPAGGQAAEDTPLHVLLRVHPRGVTCQGSLSPWPPRWEQAERWVRAGPIVPLGQAPPFEPLFQMATLGGFAQGLTVGRLGKSLAVEKQVRLADSLIGREGLMQLRDELTATRHVMPILAIHWPRSSPTVRVRSPWYVTGALPAPQEGTAYPWSLGDRARILADAWTGIAELHGLGYVHSDIKPENIFLDRRMGVLRGVIGDIDNVLQVQRCEARAWALPSSPTYGAPFPHCRPERDQVALVMVTAELLSNQPWRLYASRQRGWQPGWGISTPAPTTAHVNPSVLLSPRYDEPGTWQSGIYRSFARHLRTDPSTKRGLTGDVLQELGGLVEAVDAAAEAMPQPSDVAPTDPSERLLGGWVYSSVAESANRVLRAVSSRVPIPAAPQPPQ